MYRILNLSIVFFIFSLSAFAENSKPQVYKGEIELKGGIIKVGSLNIDFETDLVRFYNKDGTIETYSPFNIVSLYFYDDLISQPRTFVALSHPPKKNTNARYYLFELMKVGEMDILRKSIKNSDYNKLKEFSFSKRVREYDKTFEYYVFFNGELIPLSKFNSSILPIIKKGTGEQLDNFISERRIDLRDKLQPLMVVEYYNAIGRKGSLKASLN